MEKASPFSWNSAGRLMLTDASPFHSYRNLNYEDTGWGTRSWAQRQTKCFSGRNLGLLQTWEVPRLSSWVRSTGVDSWESRLWGHRLCRSQGGWGRRCPSKGGGGGELWILQTPPDWPLWGLCGVRAASQAPATVISSGWVLLECGERVGERSSHGLPSRKLCGPEELKVTGHCVHLPSSPHAAGSEQTPGVQTAEVPIPILLGTSWVLQTRPLTSESQSSQL